MSAFSLLFDSITALLPPAPEPRKACRMNFGFVPRLDTEREADGIVCSEYVSAKAAFEHEATEETIKAFHNAKGTLLSRLRCARRGRIDANGCRFTLHENGGITVNHRLRKYQDRAPYLINAF